MDLQLVLFDAMVLPVLTYGCEIWGYKVHKAIEVVHLTILKHILGVKKQQLVIIWYMENWVNTPSMYTSKVEC